MSGASQMAGGHLLSRQEEVSYDSPRLQFPECRTTQLLLRQHCAECPRGVGGTAAVVVHPEERHDVTQTAVQARKPATPHGTGFHPEYLEVPHVDPGLPAGGTGTIAGSIECSPIECDRCESSRIQTGGCGDCFGTLDPSGGSCPPGDGNFVHLGRGSAVGSVSGAFC